MALGDARDESVVTTIHLSTRGRRAFVLLRHGDGDVTIQLREYGKEHGVFTVVEEHRVVGQWWADRLTDLDVPAWGEEHRAVLLLQHRRNHLGPGTKV